MSTLANVPTLLNNILSRLPNLRPLPPDVLQGIVAQTLANTPLRGSFNAWEIALKRDAIDLVNHKQGGDLNNEYWVELCTRLDIALSLQEQEIADITTPLSLLQDLSDMHDIHGCVKLFDWLEMHSERVTKGIVEDPKRNKGKQLLLLRQLNTLVRRVSKAGDSARFNGRIITYLSGVFPICEKSAVNLRGDYGPQWENVSLPQPQPPADTMDLDEAAAASKAIDAEAEKVAFQNAFWSLQTPFSNPNIFSSPGTMKNFRENITKVLPVLSEATRKERINSGTAAAAGQKRKRENEFDTQGDGDQETRDYFFTRLLTNYDLLELELTDLNFRRQIILQILILFNYLITCQPADKDKKPATGGRKLDFVLNEDDAKWVRSTWDSALEELRAATGQMGFKTFQDTITDLLDREKAWARWKSDGCPVFEKPALPRSDFEEAASKRRKFLMRTPPLEHRLGTEDLTEIWDKGYKGRSDLANPPKHVSFERYLRDYKSIKNRISMKQKQLEMLAIRKAVVAAAPSLPSTLVRQATPEPTAPPTSSLLQSPHGLPPRPANPLGQPSRPTTPATTVPVITTPAPVPTLTPANVVAPAAPKPKFTDPQFEAFFSQKEILVWRGLRSANREGFLQQAIKSKDSQLADLEGIASRIEAEATNASKTVPAPGLSGLSSTTGATGDESMETEPKSETSNHIVPSVSAEIVTKAALPSEDVEMRSVSGSTGTEAL